MSDSQNYISKVHLCNYKSIVDAAVDFKPGLNIIIGKNGSGKTSMLEGLDIALDGRGGSLEKYPAIWGEFRFKQPVDDAADRFSEIRIKQGGHDFGSKTNLGRVISNENPRRTFWLVEDGFEDDIFVNFPQGMLEYIVRRSFTRFSMDPPAPFLDNFNFGWLLRPSYAQFIDDGDEGNSSLCLRSLRDSIFLEIHRLVFEGKNSEMEIDRTVKNFMVQFIKEVLQDVKEFTPITDIEAVSGQIEKGTLEGSRDVFGYRFRFKINNQFIPFSQLSDGTKRILRIVLEGSKFEKLSAAGDTPLRLMMIEEPELGIHPHQLHLLLLFLKEKAKSYQIILTTHSPQVLDILDQDELDRIIIADFDSKRGSQFRHLNQKEIQKAQSYMQNMQLSDYWRFSDLELR